jgi:uridine kinase
LSVTRIAVDGMDCAGKTTFADALGKLLQAGRLSVDEFLRPVEERHGRGSDSPEGYYRDSFDNAAFRAAVMSAPEPLVADGVFLQRPELADLWDLRIWLDISFEAALERAIVRDAGRFDDVRGRYERRYFPGQRLYLAEVDPRSRADIVVAA